MTVREEDSDGNGVHAANGLRYDQLNILLPSSQPVFLAGTTVEITVPAVGMPLSTSPLGVFVLYTATDVSDPAANVKIESAADGSTTVNP